MMDRKKILVIGITLSICSSVALSVCPIVSAQYLLNRSTIFFTKLGMVVYYHEAMCHAKKLVHYLQCQGHSEGLYDQNVTIFFTKLGIAVNYHESMCHVEKLILYLQCQGHSEGLYNQNMTIFTISSKLLVPLQPNLVW